MTAIEKQLNALQMLEQACRTNIETDALLGEIIATLTMPQNQPQIPAALEPIIKVWEARYLKITQEEVP